MSFRLTQRSMTLDDLEMLLRSNFVGNWRDFANLGGNEATTAKRMKIDQ